MPTTATCLQLMPELYQLSLDMISCKHSRSHGIHEQQDFASRQISET